MSNSKNHWYRHRRSLMNNYNCDEVLNWSFHLILDDKGTEMNFVKFNSNIKKHVFFSPKKIQDKNYPSYQLYINLLFLFLHFLWALCLKIKN